MQAFCTASGSDQFAARLLSDTDCQAFGVVERGYAALAQPGGAVSTALTGLLVIAVALFGYRLLLGRGIVLSEAIGLMLKIGIVLLIATSWGSWQALAYDGLARAPTQIASEMLTGIGAPPPLESLQSALDRLADASVGYRMRAGIASPLVGGPAAAAAALNMSSVLLTLSIVGLLVIMRVVLAVLLAIAPAMAGFLLFDGTRGMAQGWLGAMAAAAIAPLFVLIVASVEFAIMAPMIGRLLAEQAAGQYETASVMPIGLVAIVFSTAIVVAVRAGSRIGFGIRLAAFRRHRPVVDVPASGSRAQVEMPLSLPQPSSIPSTSRALEAIARRDAPNREFGGRLAATSRGGGTARDNRVVVSASSERSGLVPFLSAPGRMRTVPRKSRAANRRDG